MITRDDWLTALGLAKPDDPDALSVKELAQLLQVSERGAGRVAARLVESGKAVEVRKRDGPRAVKAYRLINPAPDGGPA